MEEESHQLGDDLFTKAITVPGGAAIFKLPDGGEWVDYFSGDTYSGGTQVIGIWPLDRFPLFIRKGSIIPTEVNGKIVFMVYPREETRRTFYLPSGEGTDYLTCEAIYNETTGKFTLNCAKPFEYTLIVKG